VADAAARAVDTRTLILDAPRSRLLADGYAGLATRLLPRLRGAAARLRPQLLPIRSALRRIGMLIRQREEGGGRDARMPTGP
jgi:hypothetical protein